MHRVVVFRIGIQLPMLNRRLMSTVNVKRFYKHVDIKEADGPNWTVVLDGRQLKTPAKNQLLLPSRELAFGIAMEWDAQVKHIKPYAMPLMTMASTAIDRMPTIRQNAVGEILNYRFDEPLDLALLQRKTQDPILQWAETRLGGRLHLATGLEPATQPQVVVNNYTAIVENMDSWHIVGLECAAWAAKSAVIGLALVEQQVDIDAAYAASHVEETYQTERFGVVEGGHDLDRANVMTQLAAADCFVRMLSHTKKG